MPTLIFHNTLGPSFGQLTASTDFPSCVGPRKDGQSAPIIRVDEPRANAVVRITAALYFEVVILLLSVLFSLSMTHSCGLTILRELSHLNPKVTNAGQGQPTATAPDERHRLLNAARERSEPPFAG
jgi:hypothetical protein